MLVRTSFSTGTVLASLALFTPQPVMAAETSAVCNAKSARLSLAADDFAAICACQEITVSFISRIQRDKDFGEVLNYAYDACPLLAGLLTDTATASLEEDEHERGGDPEEPPQEEPPQEEPPQEEPPEEEPEPESEPPYNGF